MKNKKLQISLLVLLLLIILIMGVWLLTRSANNSIVVPPSTEPNKVDIKWLTDDKTQFKLSEHELVEGTTLPNQSYSRFLVYDGQLCQFTYLEAEDSYQLASTKDGQVLKTYDRDCFAGKPCALSLDAEGNLWAVYWDDSMEIYCLGLCEPGKAAGNPVPLDMLGGGYVSPVAFALWDNYAVVQYETLMDDTLTKQLLVINRADHTAQTIGNVKYFCLDNEGSLYCLIEDVNSTVTLEKRTLAENKLLWTKKDLPIVPTSLWTLEGADLFLLSGYQEQWKITAINTETSETGKIILDVGGDTGLGKELSQSVDYDFGIGQNGQICISMTEYDLNPENLYFKRHNWKLDAFIPEIDPADMVTLTITSPYPVDSMISSVRMYQRQHPEVQVVWDTQYSSREEFQKNILQYKEKLATRTMTGDVGDIQMIVGAGLSQDIITNTDAFIDLVPYLAQCSFKEDLEQNFLEPLRGEDGAIRALPLGVKPNYVVYNETLLQELGNPFDPDTVTWSQLLDLALQWKQDGMDLSLTSTDKGDEENEKVRLLTSLLLANLYGFQQEDGSVDLDQPCFRELMKKLKELWNSPQLVRTDGNHRTSEGFFQKSIFATIYSTAIREQLGASVLIPEKEEIRICAAPIPWGEKYKKQQGYGFCWGIPSSSQNQDAAWDLLEFMISSDGLPGYTYSQDTCSLNNAAFTSQCNHSGFELGSFFDQLQNLRKLPIARLDEPYGWVDAVLTPMKEYLDGNCTLDESLALATDNWERFLKG